MTDLKDYLSGAKYIYLDSVKYINHDDTVQTKPEMNCFDDYICQYKDDSIKITVTRYVNFAPTCLFSAEVSYTIIHKFDKSKCKNFNISEYDLQKIVQEDIDYFIPDEMDRVSLILSQITDAFEGRPLITAPSLLLKKNSSKNE